MNLIKSLNRICFSSSLFKPRPLLSCRGLTSDTNTKDLIDEESVINARSFADLNVSQFESLATNESELKEIESILSHYEHQKYTTLEVPTTLKDKHMKSLMEMKAWPERNKYLYYLFRKEVKSLINKEIKQIEKKWTKERLSNKYKEWKTDRTERSGVFNRDGHIIYGLWHNTLFTRISHQYVSRYTCHRLRTAALFGQKVVIDMTIPRSMKQNNCDSKFSQLLKTYQVNRRLLEPFDLNFCNLDYNGIVMKSMEKTQNLYKHLPYFSSNFTEKSYLDLFDRNSLVYLTPNATKELEYDCNKVYIIGFSDGFDANNYNQMISRKECIQLRRLPIDKHVFWSGPTKDLKSYVVLSILNDVRQGVDWRTAIESNVEKRFIKPQEMVEKERAYRSEVANRHKLIKFDLKQIFEDN